MAVRFSKCCSPVPGDEIVGYITRGRGVTIHRTDCVNMLALSDIEKDRLIDADWEEGSEKGNYIAEIQIYGHNRKGLLADITKVLTEKSMDIISVHTKTGKNDVSSVFLAFEVNNKEELNTVVEKIRQIESVIDIERT